MSFSSLINVYVLIRLVILRSLCLKQDSKQLVVSNVRTMKMNEDVLVVAASPDAKYILVALLDCTVKVKLDILMGFLIYVPSRL